MAVIQSERVHRSDLIRTAFVLEWITLAWVALEAAVGLSAAIEARSTSLLAFGIDSVIEAMSAGVLIWRLTVELRHGAKFSENAERKASQISAVLLFALAAYVVLSAGWSLWTREGQQFTTLGLAITVATIPVMYGLARKKISIAEQIGSRALRADAMETVTCGWLSVVVVAGLLAQLATAAWWIDSVASLAIVYFLVREGREAWAVEECGCSDCH